MTATPAWAVSVALVVLSALIIAACIAHARNVGRNAPPPWGCRWDDTGQDDERGKQ